ncbi:hypothetical protein [Streptomyces sp. NPDC058735]|uniref:hypothetical protein n=1 Tax=unclassified Streptomyces TaxID=2593676 RepID=UPI00369D870B
MRFVETDSETLQWFPTSMHWNSEGERDEWAELCALAVLHAHEENPKRRRIKGLRRLLSAFVADFSKLTPADQAFLFIPDPDELPVPAFLLLAESEGHRDTTLRQIVQADSERSVREVEVDPFTTERLGEGLRSTRYWSTTDERLFVTVRYGWRVEKMGIDLCFYMVWNDPGRMAAYAEAVDEFTQSLWVSEVE